MLDLVTLLASCAPSVAPETMTALVDVESSGNPYAIGVVDGRLERQPETLAEALSTARALEAAGWNYSVGLAQVNRLNFKVYRLTLEQAFEPCRNLATGAAILGECYARATIDRDPQVGLRAALSCYYSGGFERGFQPDDDGTSYVERVLRRVGPKYIE